ncbi:MAG: trypsin-like peptidase domain-containing protein [Chloroflexi bacterium]|nr:trypsin-like peptidase domain-containing protein [Chloroflexota bacterium]
MNGDSLNLPVTPLLNDEMAVLAGRLRRSLVQINNHRVGIGAGIIWREDGIILTNHHVGGRGQLSVILLSQGNAVYPARVIAADPEIDLAFLQIQASRLPPALVADSRNLHVGQLVFAIGHPWGQVGFLTAGIISSLDSATTRRGRQIPILRSDVTLAPGNSGGPLVNAAGGVVGINTLVIGGDQGVAIPIHLAQAFADQALQRAVVPEEVSV